MKFYFNVNYEYVTGEQTIRHILPARSRKAVQQNRVSDYIVYNLLLTNKSILRIRYIAR